MAFFSSTKLSADDFYKVVDIIDNVEIRKYNNRIHASYIPINSKDRNNSFRNIASYIFGGNSKNQKIAMTSPVVIKLHNSHEMAFIMPKKHVITGLPIPNNNKIQIYEEPESVKACIENLLEKPRNHFFIFGCMQELGKESDLVEDFEIHSFNR